MNELVSIIVPVYKVELYLEKCVNSIINQTYKNIEIILVDDGSPDNCGQICDILEKRDKRIRVVHQKNMGVSGARNAGLDIMTGKYVMFVDSDDYINDDIVEKLIENITNNNVDISNCGIEFIYADKRSEKSFMGYPQDVVLNQKDALKMFFTASTAPFARLFKRDVIDTIRFDTKIKIGEDLVFVTEVFLNAKIIAFTKYNGYSYFVNDSSVTNQNFSMTDFEHISSRYIAMEKIKAKYPDYKDICLNMVACGYKVIADRLSFINPKDRRIFSGTLHHYQKMLKSNFDINFLSLNTFITKMRILIMRNSIITYTNLLCFRRKLLSKRK